MFFNNKFNIFFGLNLTLVYTFPMCMAWRFHFPIRNYDFKATDWHTSFHITCRCENTAVFMNESIWPEGAYVRWWGEKRRSSSGSDHNDSSNEGVVGQTVTMADAQPIIDI